MSFERSEESSRAPKGGGEVLAPVVTRVGKILTVFGMTKSHFEREFMSNPALGICKQLIKIKVFFKSLASNGMV